MIKDLINKLDKVLKFSKQSFKISKILNSDVEVEYPELKEGIEVLTSSSNGSTVATDGEYELENGDKFIVKDGVIAEILNVQPEDVEEIEEMEKEVEEKVEDVIEEVDEEKVEIDITEEEKEEHVEVNEVEALKAEIEALKKEIEVLKKELPSVKDLEDFKNAFIKELKSTPAQFNAVVVKEKETENDKWSRLAKSFS